MRCRFHVAALFLLFSSGRIEAGSLHPDNIFNLPETGTGRYGTFLAMADPRTGRFLPNTPYRLVVENDRMGPVYGVTDAFGRTQFVRTRRPPEAYVVETIGGGNFGRNFVLKWDGDGSPLDNRIYRIIREDGSVIEGVSDDLGNTKYIMGDHREDLKIDVMSGYWYTRWYGAKVGGPIQHLCEGLTYFHDCFKVAPQECAQVIRLGVRQCRTDLRDDPHAPFPSASRAAAEWPVQFAYCVVSDYSERMKKRNKTRTTDECQELTP